MANLRYIDAKVLGDTRAELGEGPVWEPDRHAIVWVDILGSAVHRTALDGQTDRVCRTPSHVGCVTRRESGGYVLTLADGFWILESGATDPRPVRIHDHAPGIRFNDGKCDPAGRLLAGTMAYKETPGAGELLRLDPGWKITRLLGGVTISNGLGWSPDGRTLYYADTPTRRVDAFDYDVATGTIGARRPFVTVPISAGLPDGLAVDEEGGVWVALWGGGAVHRYLADGTLAAVVRLPVTNATSCAFGGPNLDRLVITSARAGLDEDRLRREAHAGGLFVADPGVRGLAVAAFAG